jgi:hypothetical protein
MKYLALLIIMLTLSCGARKVERVSAKKQVDKNIESSTDDKQSSNVNTVTVIEKRQGKVIVSTTSEPIDSNKPAIFTDKYGSVVINNAKYTQVITTEDSEIKSNKDSSYYNTTNKTGIVKEISKSKEDSYNLAIDKKESKGSTYIVWILGIISMITGLYLYLRKSSWWKELIAPAIAIFSKKKQNKENPPVL